MWFPDSARYLPQSEWADALRSRALSAQAEIDLRACLETFRRHDAFYADRLTGLTDWRDIPPLERSELSAVPVIASEALHETRSSGTTGAQAVVRNTAIERRFRQALAYRPFLFYPLSSDAAPEPNNIIRQVVFVDGKDVDPTDKQQWPFEFGGHTYLTWRAGIAAAPEHIHALLQSVRPQVVRGLTSGLVRFVDALQRTRQKPLEGLGVQVVSPSGELLSDAWRSTLHEAFAAPVLDRYGATETGSIAWQCPYCDDYHVNSDEIIVEDSEEGVLATPLFIESQPLLRYRLDDRIQLHTTETNCRIRLPVMTVLEARRDDWIIDGAGLKVSPLSFQFERVAGLKAWHLHQLSSGALRLYFDSEASSEDIHEQLAKQLQQIVTGRDYELVEGVWGLERGGKFKRVTSDLNL
jgi:phenylacetate-coenzyme A ligase PaaK-like adenylate-forming protein